MILVKRLSVGGAALVDVWGRRRIKIEKNIDVLHSSMSGKEKELD